MTATTTISILILIAAIALVAGFLVSVEYFKTQLKKKDEQLHATLKSLDKSITQVQTLLAQTKYLQEYILSGEEGGDDDDDDDDDDGGGQEVDLLKIRNN